MLFIFNYILFSEICLRANFESFCEICIHFDLACESLFQRWSKMIPKISDLWARSKNIYKICQTWPHSYIGLNNVILITLFLLYIKNIFTQSLKCMTFDLMKLAKSSISHLPNLDRKVELFFAHILHTFWKPFLIPKSYLFQHSSPSSWTLKTLFIVIFTRRHSSVISFHRDLHPKSPHPSIQHPHPLQSDIHKYQTST